ncbi:hypothetical protein [Arthrobacter sp. AQ5-05]|nr:hypothetical protein [Arthrobacter sp. AQ5-05]
MTALHLLVVGFFARGAVATWSSGRAEEPELPSNTWGRRYWGCSC